MTGDDGARSGVGTRRPEASRATTGPPRTVNQVVIGVQRGASSLAVILGVIAFVTGSELHALGMVFGAAVATAIVSGVCGLILGAATRFAAKGGVRVTAVSLVPLSVIACVLVAGGIADEANGYRLLDSRGAVVYALAGGVLGAVGLIAVALIRVGRGPVGGARVVTAATLTTVIAACSIVVPVAFAYADDPFPSSVAEPRTTPAHPATVGTPAFTVPGRSTTSVTPAGPGFVIGTSRVTAYDGETGAPRWFVDLTDTALTEPGFADDSTEVTTDPSGSDTVHVRHGGLAVAVDANTGGVLRRGLAPPAPADDQRLILSTGRRAVERDGQVTVTDPDSTVVDRFRLPANKHLGVEGPGGGIVLDGSGERNGLLVVRDVDRHEMLTVSMRGFAFPVEETEVDTRRVTRVANRLLVVSAFANLAVLVDPVTGTVERRFDTATWCGSMRARSVTAVPGAILVGCAGAGAERIVGLR